MKESVRGYELEVGVGIRLAVNFYFPWAPLSLSSPYYCWWRPREREVVFFCVLPPALLTSFNLQTNINAPPTLSHVHGCWSGVEEGVRRGGHWTFLPSGGLLTNKH